MTKHPAVPADDIPETAALAAVLGQRLADELLLLVLQAERFLHFGVLHVLVVVHVARHADAHRAGGAWQP